MKIENFRKTENFQQKVIEKKICEKFLQLFQKIFFIEKHILARVARKTYNHVLKVHIFFGRLSGFTKERKFITLSVTFSVTKS